MKCNKINSNTGLGNKSKINCIYIRLLGNRTIFFWVNGMEQYQLDCSNFHTIIFFSLFIQVHDQVKQEQQGPADESTHETDHDFLNQSDQADDADSPSVDRNPTEDIFYLDDLYSTQSQLGTTCQTPSRKYDYSGRERNSHLYQGKFSTILFFTRFFFVQLCEGGGWLPIQAHTGEMGYDIILPPFFRENLYDEVLVRELIFLIKFSQEFTLFHFMNKGVQFPISHEKEWLQLNCVCCAPTINMTKMIRTNLKVRFIKKSISIRSTNYVN